MQLCDEIGLTEEFISTALRDDIEAKPGQRVQELRLASEMRKLVGKDVNNAVQINISLTDLFNKGLSKPKDDDVRSAT